MSSDAVFTSAGLSLRASHPMLLPPMLSPACSTPARTPGHKNMYRKQQAGGQAHMIIFMNSRSPGWKP